MEGRAGTSTVSEGSSSFNKLEHFAELILCLAAAGLVMMKSRVVVAGQPGSTGASTGAMMSNDNIAMAGLGFAALGVLWLPAKLIVGDLLPVLSLTLAGIYIAGATTLFGLLHLFLAHVVLF